MDIPLMFGGGAKESLLPMLDQASVPYTKRVDDRRGAAGAGSVMGFMTEVVTIVGVVSTLKVAEVLIAWIAARANRVVHIVIEPGRVEYLAKGVSVKEVARHIENAQRIQAIEPTERVV